MAKPQKTNNDWLMQRTGLLIVYAWVLLAVGFFGLTAWDMKYLDNSEQYVSILAIIGGPALLIVTKILETWNQEKGAQLQDYESQASHERDMDAIRVRHAADMERNPHQEYHAEQAATDGAQNTRIDTMEEQLAEAVAEIVMLREELSASNKKKKE